MAIRPSERSTASATTSFITQTSAMPAHRIPDLQTCSSQRSLRRFGLRASLQRRCVAWVNARTLRLMPTIAESVVTHVLQEILAWPDFVLVRASRNVEVLAAMPRIIATAVLNAMQSGRTAIRARPKRRVIASAVVAGTMTASRPTIISATEEVLSRLAAVMVVLVLLLSTT